VGGSRFEASPGKYFLRSISKITRTKWTESDSSSRAPALQARSLEFKRGKKGGREEGRKEEI
jgi:hypothetical protein